MWLFNRKKLVTTEEFCNPHYKRWIDFLLPNAENTEHFVKILHWMEKEDFRFSGFPFDQFVRELVIFQFELFSHVWQCRFEFENNAKNILFHGAYTKSYLVNNGLQDVWDEMIEYNKAIAIVNATYPNPTSAIARSKISMSNARRFELVKMLHNSGCDVQVAVRIANRDGDTRPWNRPDNALQTKLAVLISNRLIPDASIPALECLKSLVHCNYCEWWDMMNEIKV